MCLLIAYWWVSKDQSWQLTTHLSCYRMILYNKVCFQIPMQASSWATHVGVTVLASVQCLCEALMLQCAMCDVENAWVCSMYFNRHTSEIDRQFKWNLRRNGRISYKPSLSGFLPGCRNVDSWLGLTQLFFQGWSQQLNHIEIPIYRTDFMLNLFYYHELLLLVIHDVLIIHVWHV